MKNVDHSSRAHALLSASGASRWLNCTPSPRLEEKFKDTTSPYAEEGTLAHEFAEIMLEQQLGITTDKEYEVKAEPLQKSKYYSEDMLDEVQKHVDYVMEQYQSAQLINKDALLIIEDKVDLTQYIENGFGTNDDMIIADGVLEVIDLKYGKGVKVSAVENPQLKLYGLGALRAYELMFDIHTVRLTVTQPRLDSISSWELSAGDLMDWGDEVVKPKAIEAYAGKGIQKAGEWCRFCKVKASCRALANDNLKTAKREFSNDLECEQKDPMLLTEKEIIMVFEKSKQITTWLSAVNEHLLSTALDGKEWGGLKLVAGRSNRKWIEDSEEDVKKKLRGRGFKVGTFMSTPKLLALGAIEKLVTKKKFHSFLGDYVIKPQGKPTLVKESDKRPALGNASAKEDFASGQD